MIEFRDVSVVYKNEARALTNVNVLVDKGEFTLLAGPTGSGKSTFLKLIYRDLKPTEGSVFLDGVNVGELPARQVPYLRRKIGIVFEDFKLLPGRTVFENVAYALEVVGAPDRKIRRKTLRALDLVGLKRKSRQSVDRLSGGEQQRTAIARAIVNRPTVLLADEPTGHLDADSSLEIMQIFNAIHEEGTTLLVATHNLSWLQQLGKKVIFLLNGEIPADKTQKGAEPVDIQDNPVLSA